MAVSCVGGRGNALDYQSILVVLVRVAAAATNRLENSCYLNHGNLIESPVFYCRGIVKGPFWVGFRSQLRNAVSYYL